MKNLVEKWKSKLDKLNKKKEEKVKTQKMRMTVTFQVDYDAPVNLYESKDPEKMAAQDMEEVGKNPIEAIRAFSKYTGATFEPNVFPILTVGQKAGLEVEEV